MPCYVYMLKCKDNTLYTGWTTDLSRRVSCHNRGLASKYTASRRPVELVYSEVVPDKPAALKRELVIKGMKRPDKLMLISESLSCKGDTDTYETHIMERQRP